MEFQMKNHRFHQHGGLYLNIITDGLLARETHHRTPPHPDSVTVTTRVVKEFERSLLIIPPETTSRPAEQGNTILPAVTRVFPVPYRSSKKILQVRYPKSYPMSVS
jgi:hypothetical protein